MNAPLLVVVHEATRTGAPRVLLDLLTSTRDRIPRPLAVHLQAEGPLSAGFRSLADVGEFDSGPAAVLVNGAAAADALHSIGSDTPRMVYVHEEGEAISVLPTACAKALTQDADQILCVSTRSRSALERLGVEPARIRILPPVVPDREPPSPDDSASAVREFGLLVDHPLVISCGEAGWRKGADLFIDVARRVSAHRAVQFAWAGRRPRSFARLLDHDTRAAGLVGPLKWLGEIPDVQPIVSAAQLLVMPSREDPQPLVPLEAAANGTATAGFAIGGIADLGAVGAAATVPYPDTVALAEEVISLLDDPGRRMELAAAAEHRRREHHSMDVLGEKFLAAVHDLLGEGIR